MNIQNILIQLSVTIGVGVILTLVGIIFHSLLVKRLDTHETDIKILDTKVDDLDKQLAFKSELERRTKELEDSLKKIVLEIGNLDKNSLVYLKDLQKVIDDLKDLSHRTELTSKEMDYNFATILEELEILKQKQTTYKQKVKELSEQFVHSEREIEIRVKEINNLLQHFLGKKE